MINDGGHRCCDKYPHDCDHDGQFGERDAGLFHSSFRAVYGQHADSAGQRCPVLRKTSMPQPMSSRSGIAMTSTHWVGGNSVPRPGHGWLRMRYPSTCGIGPEIGKPSYFPARAWRTSSSDRAATNAVRAAARRVRSQYVVQADNAASASTPAIRSTTMSSSSVNPCGRRISARPSQSFPANLTGRADAYSYVFQFVECGRLQGATALYSLFGWACHWGQCWGQCSALRFVR